MLARVSAVSNVLQQYRKISSSGPRELTPAMVRSIKEADKPTKRGKKTETQKEAQVSKSTKGQTPKKRKSDKAAPSQPQPKKQKKPARRLILQSFSNSDSEYVPPKHKSAPPSESESESSDDEASGRGDTPPRFPTPEVSVRSPPPSPPPVTIPVSIPSIFPIPTTQPTTTIPIPTPIFTDITTATTTIGAHSIAPNPPVTTKPPVTTEPLVTTEPPTTTKPLSFTSSTETTLVLSGEDLEFDSMYFSPYGVQIDDDDDEPVTKRHLKVVNKKVDQLLSSSSSGAYSEAALKALLSSVVQEHNASLSAAAKAIEASTSQCKQASLAVEGSTKECKDATEKVDKLVSEAHLFLDSLQAAAKKNAQIVNASLDTLQRLLQSERSNLEAARQVIEAANKSLHANVNDRLTQLEAELAVENRIMDELDRRTSQLKMQNYKLRTATTELNDLKYERRHLADKIGPTLDILSHIEGVPVTGVQPKQGGEKATTQPPPAPKPSTEPKGNEASVNNKEKKKKKIGEDETDNEDDVYAKNPKKPSQKAKSSDKELVEKFKKQQAELEQKRKETELLEKKKSMFPIWTIDSL
ncbi:flocculation protein FLO11-like [Lactuca sativa]|uniref:flocculation protein FLO11-like n=1 Tax=Lactuca sativa TaxID=4236 RepID=UPI0022AF48B5|nr:flocculation protein FLO11-like [Lactuca sativa]